MNERESEKIFQSFLPALWLNVHLSERGNDKKEEMPRDSIRNWPSKSSSRLKKGSENYIRERVIILNFLSTKHWEEINWKFPIVEFLTILNWKIQYQYLD